MIERYDIAGYCRISVDEDTGRENVSIENQKAIIESFVRRRFPDSTLTMYEDRDRSGYTFTQREGYQAMRPKLLNHQYDILVVKDFSRFSRRTSRGLVELEDLRDAGARIIAIDDNIDFPQNDQWENIILRFFLNEMPVTDSSRKVKSVITRRQQDGQWICAAPYGYVLKGKSFEVVPTEADIVRQIFQLYLDGWGYKKIANFLTDQRIPTPRMAERERKQAEGAGYRRRVKPEWSIVTVQTILDNDFYIGTLRQGKFTRRSINGRDVRRDESAQLVFENHHQAILDYRTFAAVRQARQRRSTGHYRGAKKYDNMYSGFLFCGDCGSPMFSMSRPGAAEAYRCGLYHRRGLKGCTSHHIRGDRLDEILKIYIRRVMESSDAMISRLNADLKNEEHDVSQAETAMENLEKVRSELQDELKATKRQRIRDIMKHPENEALLEQTYDEMEQDLVRRIEGIRTRIESSADRRNTIIRVNRAARTAMDVFDDILRKPKLDRNDLSLILDRITVYEDHIDVCLKADIDSILRTGTLPEGNIANFKSGTVDISQVEVVQTSSRRPDKVYGVNVVSVGSPSRMRMVRRISLGITTRPRSSMRRTIPVAFIFILLSSFCRTGFIIRKSLKPMQTAEIWQLDLFAAKF